MTSDDRHHERAGRVMKRLLIFVAVMLLLCPAYLAAQQAPVLSGEAYGCRGVRLFWTPAVPPAGESLLVYRVLEVGGSWYAWPYAGSTEKINHRVREGETRTYQILAWFTDWTTATSNQVVVTVPFCSQFVPPSNLRGAFLGCDAIAILWDELTGPAFVTYQVFRLPADLVNRPPIPIVHSLPSDPPLHGHHAYVGYSDPPGHEGEHWLVDLDSVQAETEYYYTVRVLYKGGVFSLGTAELAITTPACP